MRSLVYACIAVGSLFSTWALANLIAWWFVPTWHVNREPIISAFFLLFPAIPCVLFAPALALVNRKTWPPHLLLASWAVLAFGVITAIAFWFTNAAPT